MAVKWRNMLHSQGRSQDLIFNLGEHLSGLLGDFKGCYQSPSQPITARGLGERCKLHQRGLGQRFWWILD